MKRNNKIILICGLLLIILIVLATFLYSKNGKEHENIVVLNAVNDTNVDMVDRYANLTSEEIDKLMSERTLDKVSIEIEEGTLTNKGATIVILSLIHI